MAWAAPINSAGPDCTPGTYSGTDYGVMMRIVSRPSAASRPSSSAGAESCLSPPDPELRVETTGEFASRLPPVGDCICQTARDSCCRRARRRRGETRSAIAPAGLGDRVTGGSVGHSGRGYHALRKAAAEQQLRAAPAVLHGTFPPQQRRRPHRKTRASSAAATTFRSVLSSTHLIMPPPPRPHLLFASMRRSSSPSPKQHSFRPRSQHMRPPVRHAAGIAKESRVRPV